MTTDVNLLASSMIGDGLNPSPWKEALAKIEELKAKLDGLERERHCLADCLEQEQQWRKEADAEIRALQAQIEQHMAGLGRATTDMKALTVELIRTRQERHAAFELLKEMLDGHEAPESSWTEWLEAATILTRS